LEETLGAEPALRRYRAGAAVGGSISRDRTFYYVAAEREGTRNQTASDISPSAANAINRSLDAGLLREIGTRQLTIGLFPTARKETEASVKLSHTLDGRGQLIGSATTRDVAVTGSWNTTLTAHTVNELRGQVASRVKHSRAPIHTDLASRFLALLTLGRRTSEMPIAVNPISKSAIA